MNADYLYDLYPFVEEEILINMEYDSIDNSDGIDELNFGQTNPGNSQAPFEGIAGFDQFKNVLEEIKMEFENEDRLEEEEEQTNCATCHHEAEECATCPFWA